MTGFPRQMGPEGESTLSTSPSTYCVPWGGTQCVLDKCLEGRREGARGLWEMHRQHLLQLQSLLSVK